ncbi:hypothetical protein CQA49_03965 [Helicobacter sp. MIT 00-7814]|uniref:prepilin peptidase n=1 Tax=unclassified Helicobacter TaxID=2593540 RepID=UPI000E1F942D|nr:MULTISPECIES: prepilin peptidase [unclassified Helicobacter]RDU54995.1 hypothetical protein CQA49_03965 [Helicobacter sp. MIT 00-7814]RDU55974.1 hypothetical protein CQA37_03530 [Helicobacter sp. MIT 99-10781]
MHEIFTTCLYALLCVCVSFFFLRRYCHRARYLSIFSVFLPFLSAFYFGYIAFSEFQLALLLTYNALLASFMLTLLLVMAVIDFYYFALPNVLLLLFIALCVVGKVALMLQGNYDFELISLMHGFCIMGGMYLLKFILESMRKKPMLGEADILVLGGQGMIFGIEVTFFIIFLASLLAFARFGLSAIFYFLSKKQKPLSVKFPFVSYIFTATIFSMVCVPLGVFVPFGIW